MNKLNIVQTEGYPLKSERLQEIETAYSVFNSLGNLAGNFTIISGCEIVGSVVKKGFVYINGEILEFREASVTPTSTVVIIEENINRAFKSGTVKTVYTIRYATFGVADISWPWTDFKRPMQLKNIPDALLLKTDTSIFNALADAFAVVYAKLLTIEEGAQKNKDEYYQYGTVTTSNRAQGIFETDYSKNTAYIYPPAGYTMANLKAFMPSIAKIAFDGDVNKDDTMWCQYAVDGSRITVICNNSENRETSKINYLAIWKK